MMKYMTLSDPDIIQIWKNISTHTRNAQTS